MAWEGNPRLSHTFTMKHQKIRLRKKTQRYDKDELVIRNYEKEGD